MIESDIREPAEKICALISEYMRELEPNDQERVLGLVQGMAIIRGMREKKPAGS
mgnify:CR=1 FL=1